MAALRTVFGSRIARPSGALFPSGLLRTVACTATLFLLASCGSKDSSTFELVAIAHPDDTTSMGIDRPLAAQLTRAALAEGLVSFDAQGRVVPALADRWIVADDGRSYIFRLRDGEWRGGKPLTAQSAKDALDAALRAISGSPLAQDLAVLDEIRVMAGRVIEIRLVRPQPHFLQLLAQPELGLLHDGKGNGPMTLVREYAVARFTPTEPSRLGLSEVSDWKRRTRKLEMRELPAKQAVERFNEGAVDLVLGGRIEDFPFSSAVGILRGTIQIDPAIGLFGLQVTRNTGFLADPRNREALALAIDRTSLMAPFGVSGWLPSTRLVAPGLQGDLGLNGERWAGVSMESRRSLAASQVREWKAEKHASGEPHDGAPTVTIWLPEGPGSDIMFDKLAADFGEIGVATKRAADIGSADLRLIDDVARYPRARWFLNSLSCAAKRGLCLAEVDTIVGRAAKVVDESQRSALLGEAEARLTKANLFIPFGSPIRWSLVRGSVNGFASNSYAWHPLMPLAWQPK